MTDPVPATSDQFAPGRVEFAAAPAWVGLPNGYDAGGYSGTLGPNTLGVTGVPVVGYTAHRIGDPLAGPSVVDEYTVLTIPAFWSAVLFLAQTIATLPADVCRKDGTIRQRLDGHPIETALNWRANDLATPYTVREVLLAHAIVWGNGYLWIERDEAGTWTGNLYNLLPDRVRPLRVVGGDGRVQQWYGFLAAGAEAPMALEAADVIHIPGIGFDGERGYPVVQIMRDNLRIAKAAEIFGRKFFDAGCNPGGTLQTDKPLTDKQFERLRAQVEERHSGLTNAHKWLLLDNGVEAKALTMAPEDSQLIETRTFAVTDVCRILRVFPYYLFDLSRATWGNAGQQAVDTVKYSLSPWIVKLEQELWRKLLTPAEQADGLFVRFNVDALQRGDHVQQLDSMTKRLGNGVTSIDEERALMDLPSIGPAGRVHWVPQNWQSIDKAVAPDAPPTATGQPATDPTPTVETGPTTPPPNEADDHDD